MRRLSAKFRSRLRSLAAAGFFAALAVALAGFEAKSVHADEAPRIVVKVGGKLQVPPTTPIGVIATDPVLQQVLSQDFQVAGRLAGASATSELTLTVTLTHRALEPGMSLNEVAPGNGDAIALLKQAGVNPAPLPEQTTQEDDKDSNSDDDDTNAAEGSSHAKNDVNSYQQQGRMEQRPTSMGGSIPPLPMTNWPVPPATAQQRSAIPPYMQAYQPQDRPLDEARHEREASDLYDTIFVVRATAGNESGALTVVAVAHPGFDAHEVRKLIAEEIANSVLH
jgi:hypothetical protein